MKKLMSIILSLLMVVSIIPFSVMADTEATETPSLYKYQTIFDASEYDGATLKQYASPWYTAGLTRAYNTTYVGYDSTLDAMEFKRGLYDAAGLYYFDSTLGATAANSLGFRVWMKGGTDADTTSNNNLYFIFDTIDGETHTAYAAAWYTNSSYGVTVPAEGGWVEFLWADMDKNFRVNTNNAFVPNAEGKGGDRPTLSVGSGAAVKSENWLSKMDGFAIGIGTKKANAIYYVGDVQFIMPYTVKVDGEAYATGTYGETVTLPDEEVIGYSDGKTLYTPGSEVTITGDMEFTTIIRAIEEADFDIDVTDKVYTAEEITTTVTSLTGLVEDKDYWVYYTHNKEVGTATLGVAGLGNYVGSVEKTFNIVTRTIGEADFSLSQDTYEYTGQAIEPEITTSLTAADYEVAYSNNVNVADSPVITITGKGNCSGTVTLTFSIAEKALEKEYFTFDLEDKVYTGEEIKPAVTSTLGDADYEVSYKDNVNVGTATVTVTGKGNYKGTVEETFNITEKAITDADFTFDLEDKVYTGEEIKPAVTSTLKAEDYEVAYSANTNVGIATITVTGIGNYEGVITKEFEITPKTIAAEDFEEIDSCTYENKELRPALVVAEDSYVTAADYEVAYSENINVGTATVTVTGKGNYTGTAQLNFAIEIRTITDADFTFDLEDKVYIGEEIKPAVTSDILKDTDYEVAYSGNVNVGTATITVTGADNCGGIVQKEFKITEREITEADFVFDLEDKIYTGEEITPVVTVAENTCVTNDYFEVTYSANINVGTATITVTGKNNCKGTVTKTFKIVEKAITDTDFTFDLEDKVYTGEEIKPVVTVNNALITENDYEVTYTENINVGTAKITVSGKGNFGGKVEKEFAIVAKEISESDFTVDTTAVVYTGADQFKSVETALAYEVDYQISYENNINVGTATVVITGIGNYTGTVRFDFEITPKAITEEMFSVNTASVQYTGKAQNKNVVTGLVMGVDYNVTFTNNIKVGTAKITIEGAGNFSGTVVKTFKITKPKVGFKVKGLKVTSAAKKKATVKWKKSNKATGYAIQYSLKKNFKGKKTVYVTKAKTVKKILKGLKSGKKYYVRIAAYKKYQKNGSNKVLKSIGKYSKAKAVTIK